MATGLESVREERVSDSGSKEERIGSILTAWVDGMGSGEDEDEEAMGSITFGGTKGLIKGGVKAMGWFTARGACVMFSFTSAGAGQRAGTAGGEEPGGGRGEGKVTGSLAAGVLGRAGATTASEAGVCTALSAGMGDGDGHTISITVAAATCSVGGGTEGGDKDSTTGGGGKEVIGSKRGGTGCRRGGGGGGTSSGLRGGVEDSLIRLMTFSDSCKTDDKTHHRFIRLQAN